MIDLRQHDDVFVLQMKSGGNRFNSPLLTELNAALDEVERSEQPSALVTTGEGKFYSNGLDHLRLTIDFVPSTDKQSAPILHDWEVRYTCQPAQ